MAKSAKPRRIRAGRMEHPPRGRKNKTSLIKSKKNSLFREFFYWMHIGEVFFPWRASGFFLFRSVPPSFAAHGRFALLYPPFHFSSVFSHIASFPPVSFSHVLSQTLLSTSFFPVHFFPAASFPRILSRPSLFCPSLFATLKPHDFFFRPRPAF